AGAQGLAATQRPAKLAYLLAVAQCETCRADSLPALAGVPCPLAQSLAYLQVTHSHSEDSGWYHLVARQAFNRHLAVIDGGSEGRMAEKCDVALRKLAITLIQHLVNTGVHTEGSTPQVAFFLPQLIQCLRGDLVAAVSQALLLMAAASDLFAHRLIWALMTEQRPPEEAFNPEVKRSGWQPPRDFGLWDVATSLAERVLAGLSPASRQYWDAEAGYFDKVTAISGILKKLDKDARRAKIASELATFRPERPDLYIPTNIDCRVLGHIPTSGTPMQSAAKVPILVAFQAEQQPDGQPVTSSTHHTAACLASVSASTQGQQPAAGEGSMAEGNGQQQGGATTATPGAARTVACIFKVSALAEELLTQLLSRHPPLYWDPSCLVALMAGSSPLVWKVVRSWVYSAALAAPMRTEALLHEIMAPDIMRQGGASSSVAQGQASALTGDIALARKQFFK
ncbi:uncharacterized protein HaLaN_22904, partial [Haematococcus lacustris]